MGKISLFTKSILNKEKTDFLISPAYPVPAIKIFFLSGWIITKFLFFNSLCLFNL